MNTIELQDVNALPTKTWNYLKFNDMQLKVAEPTSEEIYHIPADMDAITMGAGAEAAAYIDTVATLTQTIHVDAKDEETFLSVDVDENNHAASTVVEVADGAKVTIAISAKGTAGNTLANNLRIKAGSRSEVKVISIVNTSVEDTYIENIGIELADNVSLEAHQYFLNCGVVAAGVAIDAKGNDSTFDTYARYLVEKRNRLNMNYIANIFGERCEGNMHANGVLKDAAKKRLVMTVDLKQGCIGSNGTENETALLLGKNVENRTLPIILCHEDQVAGSHGATIGSLSPEQLTYLQDRGLSDDEIANLFAHSVIEDAALHAPEVGSGKAIADALMAQSELSYI